MDEEIASFPLYTIRTRHFSQAPLSCTLEGMDRIAKAHGAETLEELVDLIIADVVVPISPDSLAELIDDGLTAVRVRIIEGIHRGREGWVPTAWLQGDERPSVHPRLGRHGHTHAA
jgi:hypothetical protein